MTTKAYFLLRKDLNMSPAKLAVQVGHGVDFIHTSPVDLGDWYKDDRRKIVLQVEDEAALEKISKLLEERNVDFKFIEDKGFTEFQKETITGIVIYPTRDVPGMIKHLPTYK